MDVGRVAQEDGIVRVVRAVGDRVLLVRGGDRDGIIQVDGGVVADVISGRDSSGVSLVGLPTIR